MKTFVLLLALIVGAFAARSAEDIEGLLTAHSSSITCAGYGESHLAPTSQDGEGVEYCNCYSGYAPTYQADGTPDSSGCAEITNCAKQNISALETAFPPAFAKDSGNQDIFKFATVGTGSAAETHLQMKIDHDVVAQREWTIATLANDAAVDESLKILYPGQYWQKSNNMRSTAGIDFCIDEFSLSVPWAEANAQGTSATLTNYGFAVNNDAAATAGGYDRYVSFLTIHEKEQAATFRGGVAIYRTVTSVFPLRINLETTIEVSDLVNVFAPVDHLLAIVEQSVDFSQFLGANSGRVDVTLRLLGQLQWPFYNDLEGDCEAANGGTACTAEELATHVVSFPQEAQLPAGVYVPITWNEFMAAPAPALVIDSTTVDEFTTQCGAYNYTLEGDNYESGLPYCGQYMTLTFSIDLIPAVGTAAKCDITGNYQFILRPECRVGAFADINANLAGTAGFTDLACPFQADEGDGYANLAIVSNNMCPTLEVDVNLAGTLSVYEDFPRTVPRTNFFVDTDIFYRANVYVGGGGSISLEDITLNSLNVDLIDGVNGAGEPNAIETFIVYGSNILTPACVADGADVYFHNPDTANAAAAATGDFTVNALPAGAVTSNAAAVAPASGIILDFQMKILPKVAIVYTLDGATQQNTGASLNCGITITNDENKVVRTRAEFSVSYVGGVKRVAHMSIGEGEEAQLIASVRQDSADSSSASSQGTVEYVVSVPRGEDNSNTPGAVNTGNSKDAAATLNSFLF